MTTRSVLDPLRYLNVPLISARATLALAKALADIAPPPQLRSEPLEVALAHMLEVSEELEEGYDARLRAASSEQLAVEGELDGAKDGGWMDLRDRLQSLTRYDRPGFHRLASEPDAKVDYAGLVARGQRARVLIAKLFSDEGLAVLRRSYAEQAVSTATILRVIEEDELTDELEAVLGEDLVAVLRDLQRRYEDMVAVRAARQDPSVNIRKLRDRLRETISLYATAVLGLHNPKDPSSRELVEDSLRPVLSFRAQYVSSGGAGSPDKASEGEAVEAGAPELGHEAALA